MSTASRTSSSAAKRISQATFDDAVRENMDVFGQSMEEAITDAVAQFESAGVDLSNIVKGDSSLHPVLSSLKTLETYLINAVPSLSEACGTVGATATSTSTELAPTDVDRLCGTLHALEAAVSRDPVASRAVAASNGAVKVLTLLIAAAAGHSVGASASERAFAFANAGLLVAALKTLRMLVADAGECHRLVAVGFAPVLVAIAESCFTDGRSEASSGSVAGAPTPLTFASAEESASVQAATMHLAASLATRREGFKIALFNAGAPRILANALDDAVSASAAAESGGDESCRALLASVHAPCVAAASSAVARLLADDDMSVEASKAFSFARTLAIPQPAAGSATPLAAAAAAASAAASRPTSAGTVTSTSGVSVSPSEAAIARASSDMAGLGLVPRLLAGLRVFLHEP